MITEDKVIELFCIADDFCKFFDVMMTKYTLKSTTKRKYHRDSTMSKAEIMLIMILFHDSGYRCLKHFYLEKVCKHMRHLFPKVVSYNRFVELEKEVAIPLALFIKKVLLGKCTGISFVDSTSLRVCKNQRIHIHKTFKGIAQRGKCSMGWFFGFKLHLICNECGELLNFMITPGDVDDRKPLEYKAFVEFIYGKLVGDKGYISKNLFKRLFVDGIQLITKLKSNMKGALMSVSDKLFLRKRAIIETVNDELKNIAQVEHSEQSAEQVEEPADQTNEQENTKAAPAKASSKKETTETAATEQMKSKLEAKRRENVGRPKKSETAKSAKKPQEIRATFIVDPDLVRKVKYISLVEGILLRDVISQALNNYVDAWEEKNKKIRLPKAK